MADLTPDQLKELGEIQTCAVANAIETFDVIPRNEGFMLPANDLEGVEEMAQEGAAMMF